MYFCAALLTLIYIFGGVYGFMVFIEINRVRVVVFNATFNNISMRSWWSVLLVEETGGPRENHRPAASC